ncbi:hypothetical protein [Acinetobacter baumannii]|uniref:hypothetical protein n=1 Tax=Acinetobacter baumannii TaxID=470 RepID=UPI003D7F65A3
MRNFILYGLASAFNRGGVFLILPLLAALLSVVDYGKFSLYMTVVQLLVPLISLNISLLVGREIYEKPIVVKSFVVLFNRFSIFTIIVFFTLNFFIRNIIY